MDQIRNVQEFIANMLEAVECIATLRGVRPSELKYCSCSLLQARFRRKLGCCLYRAQTCAQRRKLCSWQKASLRPSKLQPQHFIVQNCALMMHATDFGDVEMLHVMILILAL